MGYFATARRARVQKAAAHQLGMFGPSVRAGRPETSSGRLARAVGVDRKTVWRWLDAGLVAAVRSPGGQYRIAVEEALRVLSGPRPTHHGQLDPFWFLEAPY